MHATQECHSTPWSSDVVTESNTHNLPACNAAVMFIISGQGCRKQIASGNKHMSPDLHEPHQCAHHPNKATLPRILGAYAEK